MGSGWDWLTRRRDGKNSRLANGLIAVFLVGVCFIVGRNYVLSTEIHDALCTFRADLITRVEQGRQIVKDNPAILKDFGISKAQLEVQTANQQRTIDSLDDLNCD